MSLYPTSPDARICFVNCGLPGEQCACFRAMFANDLACQMKQPLPLEIQEAMNARLLDHLEE